MGFGVLVEDTSRQLFISVDKSGHAPYKAHRLDDARGCFAFHADLDSDGEIIVGKHKSAIGRVIPSTKNGHWVRS
jgi:hypothetical protein